jgi:hypothetical protein
MRTRAARRRRRRCSRECTDSWCLATTRKTQRGWTQPLPYCSGRSCPESRCNARCSHQQRRHAQCTILCDFAPNVNWFYDRVPVIQFTFTNARNPRYTSAATDAAVWALRTLSVPNEPGLMYDGYDQVTRAWLPLKWNTLTRDGIGRPMNDDSVFLRASQLPTAAGGPSVADAARLRAAFYEVLDRLLLTEGPPGNWGGYVPCSGVNGTMHPRQAFWWGMPFIEAYRDTRNATYLAVAQRSAEWCVSFAAPPAAVVASSPCRFPRVCADDWAARPTALVTPRRTNRHSASV